MRLRQGIDDAQLMPEHDSHGDDAEGVSAVAARKVRAHDVTLAEILEYDPSDHWIYKSMKTRSRRPRQYIRLVPHSEVEKSFDPAISWQKC